MALTFHPRRGMLLVCDFNGFKPPEMVKHRPVVVISGKGARGGVCTVVPLSSVEPEPVEKWHHLMDPMSLPEKYRNDPTWAKCDMVTTIALARLDRVCVGREGHKRIYEANRVSAADLSAIEHCVTHALCIRHLIVEQK